MHEGHIKLFRKLKRSPYYKDSQYVHLWAHLLLSVNWTEKRLKIDKTNQFIDLLPGQILTSRKSLFEQTGIEQTKIERILKVFESEQQIAQQTFTKYRVISITNWSDYQHSAQEDEHETHSRCTADAQQMHTNKKVKKEKKENTVDSLQFISESGVVFSHSDFFTALWKIYPRKIGKPEALSRYNKTVKTEQDMKDINTALGRYLREKKDTEMRFIAHGSTWFNEWRGWVPEETE